MLRNAASVDACDSEGRTALRAAVFSGHEHIVKLLLKYNADGKSNSLELNLLCQSNKQYKIKIFALL